MDQGINQTGVVIIGRNEGERLVACLRSLATQTSRLIYVDSASTDLSIDNARAFGAQVLSLDLSQPFTAARARNEGYRLLRRLYPDTEFVQFVDGDCEVNPDWIRHASTFLAQHPDVAVACGRRRERHPENSVYNMLCDLEWNTPVGETKACGGDALMRAPAFDTVQGFRASLIAGEEPELCIRIRLAGWKIWRLDHEMTLHDAAMTTFRQWWRRTMRTGYGYAEGRELYGDTAERHWVAESRRSLFWGLLLPLLIFALALLAHPWYWLLFGLYPAQVIRLAARSHPVTATNWWHALFLVLGKFPEAIGNLKYRYNRLFMKNGLLIEYK